MKVIIPSTSASKAASISACLVLVKQIIFAFKPSLAIVLTDFFSFSDTIGKPASIWGIPSSSSLCAISNFSSNEKHTPGVCSPSLRVVSYIFILLGRLYSTSLLYILTKLSLILVSPYILPLINLEIVNDFK